MGKRCRVNIAHVRSAVTCAFDRLARQLGSGDTAARVDNAAVRACLRSTARGAPRMRSRKVPAVERQVDHLHGGYAGTQVRLDGQPPDARLDGSERTERGQDRVLERRSPLCPRCSCDHGERVRSYGCQRRGLELDAVERRLSVHHSMGNSRRLLRSSCCSRGWASCRHDETTQSLTFADLASTQQLQVFKELTDCARRCRQLEFDDHQTHPPPAAAPRSFNSRSTCFFEPGIGELDTRVVTVPKRIAAADETQAPPTELGLVGREQIPIAERPTRAAHSIRRPQRWIVQRDIGVKPGQLCRHGELVP